MYIIDRVGSNMGSAWSLTVGLRSAGHDDWWGEIQRLASVEHEDGGEGVVRLVLRKSHGGVVKLGSITLHGELANVLV